MTTLAITPNWKNKTARFKGTVAAGEHVSVTIQNENGEGGEFIADASNLRLRVVNPCNGRTLAIFPEPVPEGETPEEWDSDLSPLRCTLNLNTVQMLKAVPPAANVPLLFVLDAYREDDAETEAYEGEFTLYFKDLCEVTHWPRKFGEEEPAPTDLDDYANIIADFNTRLTAAEETVAAAAQNAQSAAASASDAASSASTAATAATDAQTGAIAAKNAAQSAAESAATAKTAAETAQGKAEDAQAAAETAQGKAEEAAAAAAESAAAFVVDDTLSVEGAAADAKAVGDANQDLITLIETVQDNLDDEVAAREELDGAVQVDRQNLATEIARAQGAEQTLDATKADKATTYTKTEVDAKVAGYVNGATYDSTTKKILLKNGTTTIAEIDATDFIKDGMVSSVEIEDGKLVITFNTDAGLEPIEIPLTDIFDPANYYDKTAADALFAGKLDASVAPIPAWKEQTAYAVDDKVHYNGVIYTCKTAHTSGSTFYANMWTATMLPTTGGKMTGAVEIVNQRLRFTNGSGGLYGDIGYDTTSDLCGIKIGEFAGFGTIVAAANGIAPEYSADDTYDLDRLVVYGDVLYKCTTAITTAEAWNSTHWAPATVDDVLAALRTALAGKQNTLTFDSEPKDASTNPVTSNGILSALIRSSIVNRDMRNLKIAGLPASGTGYFVFRTNFNFDYQYADWDSSRSMWLFPVVIGTGILGLRTTSNPKVYEAILRDSRGTVTHITDLDFTISDTLTFSYNGTAYTVFGVTDDELVKPSDIAGKANDADVVHTTGNETVGGTKMFTGYANFYDFTVSHPQGQGYIRIYALANENRVHIDFPDGELLLPVLSNYSAVTLAVIENLAPDFMSLASEGHHVFAENTLCCFQGVLYRCILGYTFASGDDYPPNDSTHWAPATVEDVLAALRTTLAGKLNNTTDSMSGSLTVQGSLTVGSRQNGSTIGNKSTAEGNTNNASGSFSHAEGSGSTASASCSHAEGASSRASANGSHAEGGATAASGSYSHAEGNMTTASGDFSHAEGNNTTAQNASEHAQGKYNASHKASTTFGNAGNTLSSIGFGSGGTDRKNAVETMQDGKTFIYGLGGYIGTNPTGSGVLDLASVVNGKADKCVPQTVNNLAALTSTGSLADSGWTVNDLARYALVTKTISNSSVSLDDRADNYVDARTLVASDELALDLPVGTTSKSRDFVLALECSATPPTISYAAYATIMAEDASTLDPEEGMNIYAFTEFKPNMFIASRKLIATVVSNTPESGDQLMLAMQDRGIDTTGITSFGGIETALGLSDTDTPQDAIDAVMN